MELEVLSSLQLRTKGNQVSALNDYTGQHPPGRPDEPVKRRPVLAIVSLACAVGAFPVARLAGHLLVRNEDLLGYYGMWTGLVTFLILLTAGIILSVLSFLRREQPRIVPIAAAIANLGLVVALLSMMV